jgi:hypothetical protein
MMLNNDIEDFHQEGLGTTFSGDHRGQKPLLAGWFGDRPTHRNLKSMIAVLLRLSP